MIKTLYIGSSSACFEIENDSPYYSPEEYKVAVGGKTVYEGKENVFSVFDLTPDTDYEVAVITDSNTETVTVHTGCETCCINVRDFGAKGDGVTEDTAAIQAAINFLPDNGRLYFPAGTYLTLPLSLKSHITLDLAKDAVILGSTERTRYPIVPTFVKDCVTGKEIPFTGFEGNEMDSYQSLVHASYAEDISIIGLGKVDGNAQNGDWWTHFNEFPAARPRGLHFNRCSNITLHGITVANSATWQIHPYFSKNVSCLNCFIQAPKQSPNTDAIDPESCDGVNIIGCRFSVGDDCIAVKSNKFELAQKYHTPANNHRIRNCLMDFGHGALTLGSELSGGIQNVEVTQCYFRGTDRGLRIKSRRGRGKDSIITNVVFDNIRMENVLTPIVINMYYNCCDPDRYTEYVWSREHLPIDDRTPHLGNFAFRNMECTGVEVAACYIDGLPESPIDRVELENINVSYAENAEPGVPAMQNFAEKRCRLGLYLDNVRDIVVKNVKVNGADGEKLIADHYENITAEDFE